MDNMLFGRARFPTLDDAVSAVKTAVMSRMPAVLLWWRPLWVLFQEAVNDWRDGCADLVRTNREIRGMLDFQRSASPPEVDALDGRTLVLRFTLEPMRLYVDFDVDVCNDEVVVAITGDQSQLTGGKTRVAAAYMAAAIVRGKCAHELTLT